ncbi:methyltransferase domain-containing protein [Flavitalea flava]
MDFSNRSFQKELLDNPAVPFGDIQRNMQELDTINTLLGGHAISTNGLKQILKAAKKTGKEGRPLIICEIGCGGGDNLNVLRRYCTRRSIAVKWMGIDINPHCIAYAREREKERNNEITRQKAMEDLPFTEWIHSDYRSVIFEREKPDILFSSLFCHHFTDEEMVVLLNWMKIHAGVGWFINDLQRHPLAYYAIRKLTAWFSRSYLVKNDAPLSVLRGFTRHEWSVLLKRAGISNYTIRWKWAFRWLIVCHS